LRPNDNISDKFAGMFMSKTPALMRQKKDQKMELGIC